MTEMSKFTKQAIYASFLKFLNEKPLDKITVKDIVDDCGINRKTFYYYFQDIYDLAREMFQESLSQIRESLPPETHSWFEALKTSTEYMYENRKVTLHVFRSLGYERMSDLIYETSLYYLPLFISQRAKGMMLSDGDSRLIASYSSGTISAMVTRWIRAGMAVTPSELLDRFACIMEGTSRVALENADRLSRHRQQ